VSQRVRVAGTVAVVAASVVAVASLGGGRSQDPRTLFIDTNGGSCQRQAANVYNDAQACADMASADAAAQGGDTVRIRPGTYATQVLDFTDKKLKFIGAGIGVTTLNSLTLGAVSGGVLTHQVKNKTISNVTIGEGGFAQFVGDNNKVTDSKFINTAYLEGTQNTQLLRNDFDGTVLGNVDDLIDVYEQTRSPATKNIVFADNIIHGARASVEAAHPDGLQFCNCDGAAGDDKNPDNIVIARNKFYDNECPNIRFNTGDDIILENNYFENGVTTGISGCSTAGVDYQADLGAANGIIRYNTFAGDGLIQGSANGIPQRTQKWIGNVATGFGNSCGGAGQGGGTFKDNIWTYFRMDCATGDTLLNNADERHLDANGKPQTGSPAINAGDPKNYPARDLQGVKRPRGGLPDIGAFEVG
jgi:hypothetical protein